MYFFISTITIVGLFITFRMLFVKTNNYKFQIPVGKVPLSALVLGLSLVLIAAYYFIVDFFFLDIDTAESFKGVFVELFGALFDVLILVLLFNYMENKGEKKRELIRLKKELDLLRGGREEDTGVKVANIISEIIKLSSIDEKLDLHDLHVGKVGYSSLIIKAINNNVEIGSFANLQLSGAIIKDAKLENMNFQSSELISIEFVNSRMKHICFNQANMSGVQFVDSNLEEASIVEAETTAGVFKNVNLVSSDFEHAILVRSKFEGNNNISKVNFYKSDLSFVEFNGQKIDHSIFDEAVFKKVKFNGTYFLNCTFVNADFSQANLSNCIFDKADFTGATFDDAKVDSLEWIKELKKHNVVGVNDISKEYYIDSTIHTDNEGTPFYLIRRMDNSTIGLELEGEFKKMLFMFSNPKNTGRLGLIQELREVKNALSVSNEAYEDFFEIEAGIQIDKFSEAIIYHEPTILHISGHGSKNVIILEGQLDTGAELPHRTVEKLMIRLKSRGAQPEFIFLNISHTNDLAKSLSENDLYALGWEMEVFDELAMSFAVRFYEYLDKSWDYTLAFEQAIANSPQEELQYSPPELYFNGQRILPTNPSTA